MRSGLDGQVTGQGRAPPPPPRAAGPVGPERGRGSAQGLHGAPRARPPFPGRSPAGRDRLAQAQRFHALLGDLRPPPPRARSLRRAALRRPARPQGRSRRARTPVAAGPVPSRARGASLAQPRSAPQPRGRPGPTPGRASPRAAAAARVPDRGRASDPDVPAPAALSPLRTFPPSRLGAERESAILSLGPIRL